MVVGCANPAQRRALARHLRADGFHVLEARNAHELMAFFDITRAHPLRRPDVLIADSALPDRPGLEAIEALQHAGGVPPFILIAPAGDWSTYAAAEQLGAAYVFEASPDDGPLRSAVFTLARAW